MEEKNHSAAQGLRSPLVGFIAAFCALAAALGADVCEIYTDVDGVFTADPRVVPNARKIEEITYDEMLELASCGAQVLHNRSVEMAKKYLEEVLLQMTDANMKYPE